MDLNFAEKDLKTTRILYDLDIVLTSIKNQRIRNQKNDIDDSSDNKLLKLHDKFDKLKKEYFEVESFKTTGASKVKV